MEFHQNGGPTAKTIFITFKRKLGSYNKPYIVTFLRNKQFVDAEGLANSLFPSGLRPSGNKLFAKPSAPTKLFIPSEKSR